MITFKEFLIERAQGDEPEYNTVIVKKAIKMLNTHCKNALWMLQENKAIYRGSRALEQAVEKTGFINVDSRKTERISNNTANYYTLILDNTPSRKGYPKRSKSFIASTNRLRANDYSWEDDSVVMIPFDDAKIGFVNRDDMWDTPISIFGVNGDIHDMNSHFDRMSGWSSGLLYDKEWESFVNVDKRLKEKDTKVIGKFKKAWGTTKFAYTDNFLECIDKAYSPKATGHTMATTGTMKHNTNCEVWIEGNIMCISPAMWQELRKALHYEQHPD